MSSNTRLDFYSENIHPKIKQTFAEESSAEIALSYIKIR